MHNFMCFKTSLCIVFHSEAISHKIHIFIDGAWQRLWSCSTGFCPAKITSIA